MWGTCGSDNSSPAMMLLVHQDCAHNEKERTLRRLDFSEIQCLKSERAINKASGFQNPQK